MKLSRELSQLCWQDVKHYVQDEAFVPVHSRK